MQNWGLRIVYCGNVPPLSEDELHRKPKVQMLACRRKMHLLTIMYQRAKNKDYLDVRDLPTRQFDEIKFKVINPVIKIAFKSPNYYGSQLWDKLPLETQSAGSYTSFKNKVQKYIVAGTFNNLSCYCGTHMIY